MWVSPARSGRPVDCLGLPGAARYPWTSGSVPALTVAAGSLPVTAPWEARVLCVRVPVEAAWRGTHQDQGSPSSVHPRARGALLLRTPVPFPSVSSGTVTYSVVGRCSGNSAGGNLMGGRRPYGPCTRRGRTVFVLTAVPLALPPALPVCHQQVQRRGAGWGDAKVSNLYLTNDSAILTRKVYDSNAPSVEYRI